MRRGKFIWSEDGSKVKFTEDPNGNFNLLPFPELIKELVPPSQPTDLETAFGIALLASHGKALLPSTCEPNSGYIAGMDPWRNDEHGLISVMATGEKAVKFDIEKDWEEIHKKIEKISKYYKTSVLIEETYNITFTQFLNIQLFIRETKEKSKLNVIKYRRNGNHTGW